MMIKKKNGFINLCISLFPGAGHMYMGFVKMGVSIMTLFFGILFISNYLYLDEIIFILPVVWCFGFFDSINKNSLSDEEFYTLEDHYLFQFTKLDYTIQWEKMRTIIAVILLCLGFHMLLRNIKDILLHYFPQVVSYFIYQLTDYFPRIFISIIIIYIGINLISGKKKELDWEDNKTSGGEEI